MALKKARLNQVGDRVFASDSRTGEILGECDQDRSGAFIYVPRKEIFGKMYFNLFQETGLRLVKDDLQGNDLRVFITMMSLCDWSNVVAASQADIARHLGMTAQAVSASYRKLRERGYIEKRDGIYIISPSVGWKGTVSTFKRHESRRVS